MQDNRENHPLDLSYLTEMVGHDPEVMIEIFETFIEQTPFYMADLEVALSAKDWKKVADCVHKIKPTFSYVGRGDVRDSVQIIESNARKLEDVEKIPEKVKDLNLIINKIYIQLATAITEVKSKYSM